MKFVIEIEGSGKPLQPEDIEREESKYGFRIPPEYREFLLQHNGGHPKRCCFKFGKGAYTDSVVGRFFSAGGRASSLAGAVQTYTDRLPSHLFPIADDPGGNLIAISQSGRTRGAVYFWDHEAPEAKAVHRVAGSLQEFLELLTEEESDSAGESVVTLRVYFDDGTAEMLSETAKVPAADSGRLVAVRDLRPGDLVTMFGATRKVSRVEHR